MQQKLSFTIKKVLFLVEGSVGVWLFFKQKKTRRSRFLCLTYELFSGEKITKQQQGVMVTIFGGGGLAGAVPLLAPEYGSGSP